ncbi:DUF3883 domain-containing protein [Flavihumibacter stibioxidans]|uniref:Protein NO VEIN C-terminal domain-containing protein n=1 Tax=Flavihumibacter stibioxidans TaxID=1834163 RepID=A0ABR7M8Q6_9BACT|nr:hypothetical protein [Flavihumibacter stibioxidans]
MNQRVRTYLINAARQKDKFVYYSDVVKGCDLDIDTSTEFGRRQLSEILVEVSEFENNQQPPRPLLSSLAIYKDKNKNDHGDGFYRIAEKLGKGSFKKLKDDLFAFSEAEECRIFWQQNDNYQKFASITNGTTSKNGIDFFKQDELDFFKQWQYKVYNPNDDEHVKAKNFLMDTVWEKSIYMGREIVKRLQGFELDGKKYWSQRGWSENEKGENVQAAIIKPYTWIKVLRNTDRGKDIFFTFGIDALPTTEAFTYKIDCQDKRDSKLSPAQIELCKSLIPVTAKWNEIAFDELVTKNWDSLIETCVLFVKEHTAHYDAIIESVWGAAIPPTLFKNKLIKKEKPKDGYESIPETKKDFKGVDVDFQRKSKEQKDLGNKGETLVKQREIEFLKERNLHDKAELVDIVQDGKGYDVYSFDELGNEKFIEVKTTTGNEYSPFFLSENEVDFMRLNKNQYCIYRVYNFDEENNFAEFYELNGDIENQLLMKPTQYKVLIKKE